MVRDFIPTGGTEDPSASAKTPDFVASSAAYLAAQAAAITTYSAYTPTNSGQTVLVDATSAPITITLPTTIGNTNFIARIKKVDSSLNAVTIATTGSQLIDGQSTRTLSVQYEGLQFVSDGANWYVTGAFKRVS